jgi:hypothetical protein
MGLTEKLCIGKILDIGEREGNIGILWSKLDLGKGKCLEA